MRAPPLLVAAIVFGLMLVVLLAEGWRSESSEREPPSRSELIEPLKSFLRDNPRYHSNTIQYHTSHLPPEHSGGCIDRIIGFDVSRSGDCGLPQAIFSYRITGVDDEDPYVFYAIAAGFTHPDKAHEWALQNKNHLLASRGDVRLSNDLALLSDSSFSEEYDYHYSIRVKRYVELPDGRSGVTAYYYIVIVRDTKVIVLAETTPDLWRTYSFHSITR